MVSSSFTVLKMWRLIHCEPFRLNAVCRGDAVQERSGYLTEIKFTSSSQHNNNEHRNERRFIDGYLLSRHHAGMKTESQEVRASVAAGDAALTDTEI